jgi:hypothetical protein
MSHRRMPIGLAFLVGLAAFMAQAPAPLAATETPRLLAVQPARQCLPSRNVACANHGRFSISVSWQNQFNNTSGSGVVVTHASTDETVAFSFGDPANIELLVKILNFGNVVKLFYGELTDLHFQMTVTDTAHGTAKVYANTPGDCGAIDGNAFPGQGAGPADDPGEAAAGDSPISGGFGTIGVTGAAAVSGVPAAAAAAAAAGSCRPSATTLCLLGGRFAANVTWQNQFTGVIGSGIAGPLSSLTGTFYFTDPTNTELLVKAIDFGDHVAIFYGSLSNLQYSLQVTDTSTGGTKTYFNPPGTFCGGLDAAFPSHLLASTSFNLIPVATANAEHLTDDVALVPFTTATGGNLQVDVDWMQAADDIAIVLFRGDCTLEIAAQNGCDPFTILEVRGGGKPERLLEPGLAPGTYTIMIIDFGPNDESGTMTAIFTP